jgi:radical SAM superfamily enzyme YgiQ (UPF0313 family)
MAEVLITNSYFLHLDPKQWRLMQPYAPLGTLYAAAVLREAGFHVTFFDNTFCKSTDEFTSHLDKVHPRFVVICDDGFNYLTKMCLTNMREACFEMIAHAKQMGSTVIVSSSDATDHDRSYLGSGADFIVKGEAEVTLRELLLALRNGNNSPEAVPGLSFRKEGKMIATPAREVLRDLDALPDPAWDLANMKQYQSKWRRKHGYFSMNIVTTRGCPFKCNWCAKPIYGNRYSSRSPGKVVEEIKFLLEKFQPDHFWFCDDIFGLKPGWIKNFSELVQREKLKFRFKIQCRVDLLLEENNIESLAKAGCETVWVGAESGSQKILDAMDKGTKVQQIYEATRLLRKYGIKPAFFLQFGYPGETVEDIERTKKMLFDLMPDDIGVSVSYPLPGTRFYEMVKEDLKSKSNWTDSDDLALMYQGTYSPQFYKQLHRYIHKRFRREQGVQSVKKFFAQPFSLDRIQWRRMITLPYFVPMSWWSKRRLRME